MVENKKVQKEDDKKEVKEIIESLTDLAKPDGKISIRIIECKCKPDEYPCMCE